MTSGNHSQHEPDQIDGSTIDLKKWSNYALAMILYQAYILYRFREVSNPIYSIASILLFVLVYVGIRKLYFPAPVFGAIFLGFNLIVNSVILFSTNNTIPSGYLTGLAFGVIFIINFVRAARQIRKYHQQSDENQKPI